MNVNDKPSFLEMPSWQERPLNLPMLQVHASAIQSKPEEEWTDEERQFMEDGAKWAVQGIEALANALRPAIEAIAEFAIACSRALASCTALGDH